MGPTVRTLPIVERLADLGVRLSIDDFGTGYSSLEYLKVLPVREMKIDRSFVAGMSSDVHDAAIVRHSIDLGRSLGLRVVAEGVESAEDHAIIAGMGCDHARGFYDSRPVPAAVFEAWVVEAEERRAAEARTIAPAVATAAG